MEKVTLDHDMQAKPHGVSRLVELYDQQGNLLGYCLPPDVYRDIVTAPGPDVFSDEEIAEVMNDTDPGRPLADILADFRRQYP